MGTGKAQISEIEDKVQSHVSYHTRDFEDTTQPKRYLHECIITRIELSPLFNDKK